MPQLAVGTPPILSFASLACAETPSRSVMVKDSQAMCLYDPHSGTVNMRRNDFNGICSRSVACNINSERRWLKGEGRVLRISAHLPLLTSVPRNMFCFDLAEFRNETAPNLPFHDLARAEAHHP